MINNKRYAIAAAAGIVALLATAVVRADNGMYATAQTDDGSWEVRLRGVYLYPRNDSQNYVPLAIPENAVHIEHKWLPDIDIEYHFTPTWSSELVLTYPQTQHVTLEHSALGGPTELGSFKHLPPVLTLKYNFNPDGTFRPYVGAGVNWTLIFDTNLNVPTVGALTLDNHSIGPAVQAGFDWKLKDHWYLNMDVKWVQLHSGLYYLGQKTIELQIDPWLFGVGVGYRFNL